MLAGSTVVGGFAASACDASGLPAALLVLLTAPLPPLLLPPLLAPLAGAFAALLAEVGGAPAGGFPGLLESLDALPYDYDVIFAFGSLHNAPLHVLTEECTALVKHLKSGGRWMQLAYPKSRY